MQARHKDPETYFDEQALSCRKYYVPYITRNSGLALGPGCDVLEVGCGWGGSLSVFADMGCDVTGVDIQPRAAEFARDTFAARGLEGRFAASDIFDYVDTRKYDLVILHDSIEHIGDKERLMLRLREFLKDDGVLYIAFPAWQMPFGGHQQMAKSRLLANFPYTHLLPRWLFRAIFRATGEKESTVQYFFGLRDTGISIEGFERLARTTGFRTVNRHLYLINPNYDVKFGLRPRTLSPLVARVPHLRNFFTTTAYYLLK